MSRGVRRPGEFDVIARYLAPLAKGERGALGLLDDAAFIAPKAGHEFVVTADAVVEGVHFHKSDPAFSVAQKALRVNLSDLAAKGARPRAYLMTTAWPDWVDTAWLEGFARGLAHDQACFSIGLVGGDTVSTPGPLTISITALGEVRKGGMIRRSGMRHGDDLWVTGTIGDAGLGLLASRGELAGGREKAVAGFLDRYRVPQPRVELVALLSRVAHASIDISDGLVADLGHLARVSGVGLEIDAQVVPLSDGARELVLHSRISVADLLTAGDDYELAFAAPVSERKRIIAAGTKAGIRLSRIGVARKKAKGVTVFGANGQMLQFARHGFTHF